MVRFEESGKKITVWFEDSTLRPKKITVWFEDGGYTGGSWAFGAHKKYGGLSRGSGV
jgi:hypothetical protein